MTATAAGCLLAAAPTATAATGPETAAAKAVLSLLNAQRAAHHLPALGSSAALTVSSRRHNLAMAARNTMSHQLPGEASPAARISAVGVRWHSMAENVAWTSDQSSRGATYMQNVMYGEVAPNDGHKQNILSRSVRYVGVDVFMDPRTHKLWMTEDFADSPGPAPVNAAAHSPVGVVDSVRPLAGHQIHISGWAYDPDARTTPLPIAVYLDGRGVATFRSSSVTRNDVARIMHVGTRQGFAMTINSTGGLHSVCVFAINVGAGTNRLMTCSHVTS